MGTLTSAPGSRGSAWEVEDFYTSGTSGTSGRKMLKMVAKCFLGFAAHLLILLIVPTAIGSPVADADADAEAEADPGYGYGYGHRAGYGYARAYHHPVPHCKLTYDVVTEEACATHSVPECATVVKHLPEQVCQTVEEQACHQEQQCSSHTETVVDTTTYEECEDVITKVCTNTQVTSQSHSSVVGQTVGVAHGHGHAAHVAPVAVPHAAPAVAVPAVNTHAHAEPLCHEVPERKCRQVPVSTPRLVVTPHCVAV